MLDIKLGESIENLLESVSSYYKQGFTSFTNIDPDVNKSLINTTFKNKIISLASTTEEDYLILSLKEEYKDIFRLHNYRNQLSTNFIYNGDDQTGIFNRDDSFISIDFIVLKLDFHVDEKAVTSFEFCNKKWDRDNFDLWIQSGLADNSIADPFNEVNILSKLAKKENIEEVIAYYSELKPKDESSDKITETINELFMDRVFELKEDEVNTYLLLRRTAKSESSWSDDIEGEMIDELNAFKITKTDLLVETGGVLRLEPHDPTDSNRNPNSFELKDFGMGQSQWQPGNFDQWYQTRLIDIGEVA